MAEPCSLCILGVMDRLWFHQIILFSESSSAKQQTTPLTTLINSPSNTDISLSTSEEEVLVPASSLSEEISSSSQSSAAAFEVYVKNEIEQEEQADEVVNEKERPTRSNLATIRVHSHSSSPSTNKQRRKNIGLRKVLQKSMSSWSLRELELEEVKGFMDLGFIFSKQETSPILARIVLGLLRLGLYKHKRNKIIKLIDGEDLVTEDNVNDDDIVRDDQEEERGIIRPYLSEAWTIRRPDSPLLSLKLPRVFAAADMKRHFKFWASTVASEIQQVSVMMIAGLS